MREAYCFSAGLFNFYVIISRVYTHTIYSRTSQLITAPLDTFLTKEIEVISLGENRETNVPILSADASFMASEL